MPVPYAPTRFDAAGAFVPCPFCDAKIRLTERKDEDSFSTKPYGAHVEAVHPERVVTWSTPRKATPAPRLADVSVTPSSEYPGFVTVAPVWADVARPSNFAWLVRKSLAPRLVAAIRDGAACPDPQVLVDPDGDTYVRFDHVLRGRTMSADLRRLGF